MAEEPRPRGNLSDSQSSRHTSVPRIGVAGWSYPDWAGIVYPRGRRIDPLTYLSSFFHTIEINSSFYRIPPPRTTASWARRVQHDDAFRFTIKLYRGFTHDDDYGEFEVRAFREALFPLVEEARLGAVLLQFPWSFKNAPENTRRLEDLLERFQDYPLVVEVRHSSWNETPFFELLADRGVGFCNIDQPLIGRSIGPTHRTTSPVGYVRLHGRNYSEWFRNDAGRDERYDYLYSEDELDPWLDKIVEVSDSSPETYVVTNNHFRGQAVVNALQIRSRLEKRRVRGPDTLVDRYPVLRDIVTPERGSQGRLF